MRRAVIRRGFEQRPDKREHLHRQTGLAANVENHLPVFGRATRDGKNNLVDSFQLSNFRDIVRRTGDNDTIHLGSQFLPIIVDKAYGLDFVGIRTDMALFCIFFIVSNFVKQHLGRIASTDNHGALVFRLLGPSRHKAHERTFEDVAKHAYTDSCYSRVQYGKLPGTISLDGKNKKVCNDNACYYTINAAEIIFCAKVAPHSIVCAKEKETPETANGGRQKNNEKVGPSNTVGK